jgi:glycosyltransferase involved in cell wall biosynthesis
MKNILVITPFYPTSTQKYSGIFIENQINYFKSKYKDYNFYVLHLTSITSDLMKGLASFPGKKTNNRNKLNYTRKRFLTFPRNISHIFAARQIERLIISHIKKSKVKFDLIHAHFAIPVGISVANLKKKIDIPMILTVHGSDINLYPTINNKYYSAIKYALLKMDLVLSVSENLTKKVEKICADANVITNNIGININRIDRVIEKNNKVNFKELVFVGNLLESKGILELIETIHMFNNKFPSHEKMYLKIIGDGKEKKTIESFIKLNNIKNIRLLGSLANKYVINEIYKSGILILPSHNEGLPTVIMEAGACERMIISTTVGGIPEVIKDGVNGFLFEPKNKGQLLGILENIFIHNKVDIIKMGKNNRNKIEKVFDQKDSILSLEENYCKLIRGFNVEKSI